MKYLWTILLLTTAALAQTSPMTINEDSAIIQTGRPVTIGHVFKQGDFPGDGITNCARPVVGGVAVPALLWQNDAKNYWPDHSLKFAVISFPTPLTASGNTSLSFQAGTCDNTGFLTQSQMVHFNSDGWGNVNMVAAATGSTTVTIAAKTMLSANDPGVNTYGDCKNDYWLKGPFVTGVIVEDCTSSSPADIGWTWNGSTMSAPVTGSATTASLHPKFIMYFYPASNTMWVRPVLENPWSNRGQDQSFSSLTFTAGIAPTTMYTKSSYVMAMGTQATKQFWINADGTATDAGPGDIAIDHNFAYLKSTKAFPNYDPDATTPSPDVNSVSNHSTSNAVWATTNKCDVGTLSCAIEGQNNDLSQNSEGAPLQREDLLYLYNMSTCGTANSACLKALQMLTGRVGAKNSSLTAANVLGGAGLWQTTATMPIHVREGRTAATGKQTITNFFYCPGFADKNAKDDNTASCGGSGALNNATGKTISRDAHSATQFTFSTSLWPQTKVGTASGSGWASLGCDHWQDFSYTPYLLTGDPYYLQEIYYTASYCLSHVTDGTAPYQSNGFFAFVASDNVIRDIGWSMQATSRAAFVAPDGSYEALYYSAKLDSNMEVLEGNLNVTSTPLTPTSTNPNCTGYDSAHANRWDWGRCTVISRCIGSGACTSVFSTHHDVAIGNCPRPGTDGPNWTDTTKTTSVIQFWMYAFLGMPVSEARRMGFTNTAAVSDEMLRQLEEKTLDPTYNPYLLGSYLEPVKSGDSSGVNYCTATAAYQTTPFFSTYASLKSAFLASIQTQSTFNNGGAGTTRNFPCSDKPYSGVARNFGAYLLEFNPSSGSFTAQDTWNWLNANIPYMNNHPAASAGCGVSDAQIKFAQAPDFASVVSCTISVPADGATVSTSTSPITITCSSTGGTVNNIQATLNSAAANMPSNTASPLNTTWNTTLFSNTTVSIGCTATDTTGSSTTCPTVSVTINNSPAVNSTFKGAISIGVIK